MKKKRITAILLSLALMLTMMPALGMSMPAYADDDPATEYPLWIGSTRVTSANAADPGDCGRRYFRYRRNR